MPEQLPIQFEYWGNQTFADFFPADNHDILTHLRQSVKGVGECYIFLWGESGYGKTHLLQACCEEAVNASTSAFYFDLANKHASPEVFNDLESIELVCLDNVQALCGKKNDELALFSFFNRHRDQGHRLIISSDSAATQLPILLPDLKTRLNWGLSLKLRSLDETNKLLLLIHKAQQMGFELSPSTACFLLTHYDRRLSSLWQALDKLDLASLSAQRKLTIPFLKDILFL